MAIEQYDIFLSLVLFIVGYIVYPYLAPEYPDKDIVFLHHQSTFTATRRPGESAIYRSVITPHGRSLISGLAIAGGNDTTDEAGSTRHGNLADVWKLASRAGILTAIQKDARFSLEEDDEKFKAQVVGLYNFLIKSEIKGPVCIALRGGYEGLAAVFASAFAGLTAVLVRLDISTQEDLANCLEFVDPAVLIIDDTDLLSGDDLRGLKRLKALVSLNQRAKLDFVINETTENLSWKDVTESDFAAEAPDFTVEEDSHIFPISVVYRSETPGSVGYHLSQFTHHNLAAAIASQIKVLPKAQQWDTKDKVIFLGSTFDLYCLVMQLTALVSGSKLVFQDGFRSDPRKLISDVKPTVLIR